MACKNFKQQKYQKSLSVSILSHDPPNSSTCGGHSEESECPAGVKNEKCEYSYDVEKQRLLQEKPV